jgi:hypothetical protein
MGRSKPHCAPDRITNVVIGTVVRMGPVGAADVYERLKSEGRKESKSVIYMLLSQLALAGRIERVSRGVYDGV